MSFFRRLVSDEDGQDLIEYAFLCLFVALMTVAGWMAIRDAMTGTYAALDTHEQDIWRPADPPSAGGGGGS